MQQKKYPFRTIVYSLACFLFTAQTYGQQGATITIPASQHYHKGKLYRFFWGNHYRTVWHTPVKVRIVGLDTLKGGLVPYEVGGSRQTKSLRLRDKQGREYVLRSVDKTFGGALPENIRGTFVEDMANDQVTISNPYGALVVAPLAKAAGILHASPELVYLPKQPALGEFNEQAGDVLYMLEQRPDENWETAANFANSKKIVGTDKLLEKLRKDNDNFVDESLFVRSRLFDMLIGDWGRHEDQWRWAETENGKQTIYKPVPRDRDNAFTKFDGLVVNNFRPDHLQYFKNYLEDVDEFGFTARGLDRRLTSRLTLDEWKAIAADMQQRLTDDVIAKSVKALPAEVLPLLEQEYNGKLKARRDHLSEWAEKYYRFINENGVDIVGSEKKERFEISRVNDTDVQVAVYKITKEGDTKKEPLFKRTFHEKETEEVRLFGLGDDDEYLVNGVTAQGMKIVIIGTDGKEKIVNNNVSGRNIVVHDDRNHEVSGNTGRMKLKFHDSARYQYVYKYFKYDKSGLTPILFYNQFDRIHAGLAFTIKRQKWNKDPFWKKHVLAARYSIDQAGFSFSYNGTYTELLGKWNVNMYAVYDMVRWLNFYGLGNESKLTTLDRDYFRFRSRELYIEPSLERRLGSKQRLKIAPFFERYMPIIDTERYVSKTPIYHVQGQEDKNFTGLKVEYVWQSLNDSSLPTKGFGIRLSSSYTHPLTDKTRDGFVRLGADMHAYLPLTKAFGIAIKGGAATLTGGEPEFYQYNTVGGTRTIRGFQRERFHGTTTVYNQNELRWITNINSYLFKGKIGLFGLYDIGRVFEKNEHSDTWHYGYGGGILISPFNVATLIVSYAKSAEDKNLHITFTKNF